MRRLLAVIVLLVASRASALQADAPSPVAIDSTRLWSGLASSAVLHAIVEGLVIQVPALFPPKSSEVFVPSFTALELVPIDALAGGIAGLVAFGTDAPLRTYLLVAGCGGVVRVLSDFVAITIGALVGNWLGFTIALVLPSISGAFAESWIIAKLAADDAPSWMTPPHDPLNGSPSLGAL